MGQSVIRGINFTFLDALTTLWKESGNSISHLYAGTGALESGSALEDAKRSISRSIKNNTSDSKYYNYNLEYKIQYFAVYA